MEQRTVKPKETHADVMARLLKKAQDEGVELLRESDSEEWFATSGTMPGVIYRVSEHGCSCRGYVAFNRCKHFALYLDTHHRPLDPVALTARRAERVSDWHANNEAHARRWLSSLVAKQDRGETVPEADVREATTAVALYAAASHQPDVALAA